MSELRNKLLRVLLETIMSDDADQQRISEAEVDAAVKALSRGAERSFEAGAVGAAVVSNPCAFAVGDAVIRINNPPGTEIQYVAEVDDCEPTPCIKLEGCNPEMGWLDGDNYRHATDADRVRDLTAERDNALMAYAKLSKQYDQGRSAYETLANDRDEVVKRRDDCEITLGRVLADRDLVRTQLNDVNASLAATEEIAKRLRVQALTRDQELRNVRAALQARSAELVDANQQRD